MSMTLAPSFTESLNEQWAYAAQGASRLIVAHGNPDLIARLDDAFPETPLLDCPQADWRLDGSGLLAAILHATNQGLQNLVLAGDSLAFATVEDDSPTEEELFQRAKLAGTERYAAQEHFVEQVQSLTTNTEIAARLADGSLAITALFYRAEADVFMVYDLASGEFATLS